MCPDCTVSGFHHVGIILAMHLVDLRARSGLAESGFMLPSIQRPTPMYRYWKVRAALHYPRSALHLTN